GAGINRTGGIGLVKAIPRYRFHFAFRVLLMGSGAIGGFQDLVRCERGFHAERIEDPFLNKVAPGMARGSAHAMAGGQEHRALVLKRRAKRPARLEQADLAYLLLNLPR